MATLTYSQAQTLATKVIVCTDVTRTFGNGTLLPAVDAVTSNLNAGDYSDGITRGVQNTRQAVANALGQLNSAFDSVLVEYAQAIDVPERDPQSVLTRIYTHMADNSLAVTSRCMVFGAASAGGSNVGSGVFVRCTTDARGYAIEAPHAEVKTWLCTADANSGVGVFNEVFLCSGEAAPRDAINVTPDGSATSATITAMSGKTSLLSNTSFSAYTASGTTPVSSTVTAVQNWTYGGSSTFANTLFCSASSGADGYYRTYFGDTNPTALRFTATTWTISQDLTALRKSFRRAFPVFAGCRIRRKSSADGTVTLSLGASSVVVSLSSLSNDAWYDLYLTPGTASWFENFNTSASSLAFSVVRAGGSTGSVDVDDCQVQEFTFVDGAWFALWGSSTAYLQKDSYTTTDTANAVSGPVVQTWIGKAYQQRYLPARPAVPSSAPTVALAGAGAGNVENGAHGYKVTFVHSTAGESGGSSAGTVTVVDKTTNGKVAVSAIPTGPTGTSSRKLYRTVAAGSTYKLLATIANNSTTTYTDDIADASLGATIPAGVTWSDS